MAQAGVGIIQDHDLLHGFVAQEHARPYEIVEGDSLSNETTEWPTLLASYSVYFNRASLTNYAVAGETADTMTGEYATEAHTDSPAVVGDYNDRWFFLFAGTNDIGAGGATAAELYTDLQTIWAAAKADDYTVVAFTVLPVTAWQSNGKEAIRTAANALILSDRSLYDYVVDVDLISELADPTDTTYYNVDGVHLNATGEGVLAAEVARVTNPLRAGGDLQNLTVDGATIDDATIGATTRGAGYFSSLGVGTSSPSYTAHLKPSTGAAVMAIESQNSQAILMWRYAGSSKWQMYLPTGGSNLKFYDSADRFIIYSGGGISLPQDSAKISLGAAEATDSYLQWDGSELDIYSSANLHLSGTTLQVPQMAVATTPSAGWPLKVKQSAANQGVIVYNNTSDSLYAHMNTDTSVAQFVAAGLDVEVRAPSAGKSVLLQGDTTVEIEDDADNDIAVFTASDKSASFKGPIYGTEQSSDPTEPAEGTFVIWMSDGTGYGDDGDICIASQAGGVTNKAILFDHSAGSAW